MVEIFFQARVRAENRRVDLQVEMLARLHIHRRAVVFVQLDIFTEKNYISNVIYLNCKAEFWGKNVLCMTNSQSEERIALTVDRHFQLIKVPLFIK